MRYSFITRREEGSEINEGVMAIVDSVCQSQEEAMTFVNMVSAVRDYHMINPYVYNQIKIMLEERLGTGDYEVLMEWLGFRKLNGEYSCFDFGAMNGFKKRADKLTETILSRYEG